MEIAFKLFFLLSLSFCATSITIVWSSSHTSPEFISFVSLYHSTHCLLMPFTFCSDVSQKRKKVNSMKQNRRNWKNESLLFFCLLWLLLWIYWWLLLWWNSNWFVFWGMICLCMKIDLCLFCSSHIQLYPRYPTLELSRSHFLSSPDDHFLSDCSTWGTSLRNNPFPYEISWSHLPFSLFSIITSSPASLSLTVMISQEIYVENERVEWKKQESRKSFDQTISKRLLR